MTQISKYPVNKEIEKRIMEVFLDTMAMVTTRNQAQQLLNDWLSPTEKIMLAKRLSIALLLTKKYDQRSVAKLLRVGLETVNKVNRALQSGTGGYDMITSAFLKQEKNEAFWEKVDDVLADFFPPDHRNWSQWRKDRREKKMAVKKPF